MIGLSPVKTHLAAVSERSSIGLFMTSILSKFTTKKRKRKNVLKSTIDTLYTAVPLELNCFNDLENSPFMKSCFELSEHSVANTFLLTDWYTLDTHVMYYSQLSDLKFDIVSWIHNEKEIKGIQCTMV